MKKSNLKILQLVVGLFVVFSLMRAVSSGVSGTRASDVPTKSADGGSYDKAGGH